MKNIEKWVAVGFVAFFVGNACPYVGQKTSCEVFSPWLPMQVLLVLGGPAMCAYLAGKKDGATP